MLRQEKCLQHLFEGRFSTAGISDVVRQQIPDHGTGDSEGPTAKCGAVVRQDGDVGLVGVWHTISYRIQTPVGSGKWLVY